MWAVTVCAVVVGIVWLHWRQSDQKLADFLGLGCVHGYARLWHGCSIRGPSPRSIKGAAILIANHTCSADPSFLQANCARWLSFLIAREFYGLLPLIDRVFEHQCSVPVARDGRDVAAVRTALRRLQEGRIVCVFPEGGLSGTGRGRLRPGKGGAALLALRSRAPVYPAFIAGGPQHHYVPRAWLLPSRVRVYFGPPVDLSAYYDRPINRPLLEEVTALLMRRIDSLRPQKRNQQSRRCLP